MEHNGVPKGQNWDIIFPNNMAEGLACIVEVVVEHLEFIGVRRRKLRSTDGNDFIRLGRNGFQLPRASS